MERKENGVQLTRRAKTAARPSEMIQTMFFSNQDDEEPRGGGGGGASSSSSTITRARTQNEYESGSREMDLDSTTTTSNSLVRFFTFDLTLHLGRKRAKKRQKA